MTRRSMPCLSCQLVRWAALAGIAKTSGVPNDYRVSINFSSLCLLLVAGVYPVTSLAYDSTGKADYAFSPSTRPRIHSRYAAAASFWVAPSLRALPSSPARLPAASVRPRWKLFSHDRRRS